MLSSWAPLVRDLFRRGRTRRSASRPAASNARKGSALLRSSSIHQGEHLEDRRLMAFDLVAAFAQSDTPFFVNGQSASMLTESPQQITLRFSPGVKIDPIASNLSQITVTRAGGDGTIGNGNDVNVTPANGVGIVTVDDFPNQNQVVLRFAETLPDDLYRITIGGGLKTLAGGPSAPADSFRGGNAFSLNVRLDLGALVVAVVPQPITRGGGSALAQSLDTVDVYFNANDPLQGESARNPRNYRLVETDPVTGADIAVQIPQTVIYNASTGKATLTFAAPLGDKLYRLQVGGSDDDNGTIAKAVAVGTVFQQSVPATPAYTTNSFLGDGSADVNDVDLYKFRVAAAGTLSVRVTPAPGFTPVLRLFNATGEEITTGVDTSQPNALTYAATAAGTFHVGISSAGNAGYNPVTGVPATGTVGTTRGSYRLEISSNVVVPADDQGGANTNSSFGTATALGTLGLAGQAFNAAINVLPTIPTPVAPLGFPSNPGTIDSPGHREIQLPVETHAMPAASIGAATSAFVREYSFPDIYGLDIQGNPLRNVITENQKQRAREIFELYSRATGIRFVETLNRGLAVVTGDIRAANPNLPVPGGPAGIGGPSLVIMNSGLDWGSGEYGGLWQGVAFHEIGHALGLGHSYDVRSNMGDDAPTVLPGDYDLQHLRVLYPALGTDIDVYSFQIETDGRLSAETIVARPGQAITSTLDTVLTLYREDPATGMREIVARNDDYYGRDSFVGLELKAAAPSSAKYTYYLAVTSTGNTAFDPEVENSGANGRSDGAYRLQLGFTPAGEVSNTIVDTTGTPLDGDRDGLAGGAFNFWFRSSTAANTVYVDKVAAGRTASIVNNSATVTGIDTANLAVGMLVKGVGIQANTTIQAIGSGSITLSRAARSTNASASLRFSNGSVSFPFVEIDDALSAVTSNTRIVRIVGNIPGAAATPYLVGTTLENTPQPLADGSSFIVPAGVTVMIDEGAVLKFRGQVIDVGSSSQLISRAGAALQVLGTPGNRVQFTSYHDDSLGGNSDGVGPAVTGGQWGGIVFRADSDSASKRVFLNSVSQANILYGGGRVTINSEELPIAPIHLETARPTIAFNDVRNSAGAAISANPNSFEESNGRTGPSIRGNIVRDNSLNGLLVRIQTDLGRPIEKLTVPARFASPDITYIVPQNLFIAGGAGGYQNRIVQKRGDLTEGSDTVTGLADLTGLVVGMPVAGPGVPNGALIGSVNTANNSVTLVFRGLQPALATASGTRVDLRFDSGIREARASGRLAIDPGVVVKLQNSRVDLERGTSQFYAEGTPQKRVILTSTRDNRFGAGGTFVAVGTTANVAAAGNWGGIVVNDAAAASIDNAVISFGGGQTPVEGGFASFSTLSVDQGSLRLANSRFENNATGIYVLGAQPAIIGNDFRNNGGDLISLDANSLNNDEVPDPGRSTGPVDRFAAYDDNRGPLVRGNRATAGGVTGMVVRGDEITCESVWDDTDIVHVVRDEIYVSNFHVTTGLRLMSSPTASLVVKFRGPNAGLTATGMRTDIDDRIGGTVQVIGQPGYPVVLTSLADDTVGATLDPVGRTVTDTNGDGSASRPIAGDWRGLRFLPYSNDRNVAVFRETEPGVSGGLDTNASPGTAQTLGVLAPNEVGGDDNRRLGFEVHGAIAFDNPTDIDVYSFSGYVGSEVWFDIDSTSSSLDAMVELLDEAGTVLARSADLQTDHFLSSATRGGGLPFQKNVALGLDLLSPNPRDPGMRVVLPGASFGETSNYYVRVRSQPRTSPTADPADYQARLRDADPIQPGDQVEQGATSGSYQMRVRLRQVDEKPGSTVRFADIRYPVVGVDVQGLPQRSPLAGDIGENPVDTTNDSTPNPLAASQYVGNLLQADLNTISIAGSILDEGDIDWYAFDVNYEDIQAIAGVNNGGKTFATVFDIDYADGFRGDLTLSVFDSAGTLLFVGRDSSVIDDQPLSGQGVFVDVSRGSVGKLDPFIGPVHLPAGLPGGTQRYYVAVSSNERLPAALDMTFRSAATSGLIRLEPTNSVRRVVQDHIGFIGYHSGKFVTGDDTKDFTYVAPTGGPLFDLSNLRDQVPQISLADITRYVSWRPEEDETAVLPQAILADDLAMRPDGRLYTYTGVDGGTDTAGRLEWINIVANSRTTVGTDNIPDFPAIVAPTPFTDDGTLLTKTASTLFTTFAVDAHPTDGKVQLGNVSGRLEYTFTPPEEKSAKTSTWTFGSNSLGNLSFTVVGTLPPSSPVPDGSRSSIDAQGKLSVTWLEAVEVSNLSMTGVTYTFEPEIPPESVTTDRVDAVAWSRGGKSFNGLFYSVRDVDPRSFDKVTKVFQETGFSRLYNGNTVSAVATDPTKLGAAPGGRIGNLIQTTGNDLGLTTGMAFVGGTLYGVDNRGNFFTINTGNAQATLRGQVRVGGLPVNLQGLANGPRNVGGGPDNALGYFADKLFAIDANGFLYCFDPATAPEGSGAISLLPVFNGETSLYLGAVDPFSGANVLTGAVTGFAYSPFDFSLWRATNVRGGDIGHGVSLAPDNTRDGGFTLDHGQDEIAGDVSIYFGFDTSTGSAADGSILQHAGIAPGSTTIADLSNIVGKSAANVPAPGARSASLSPCITTAGSDFVRVPTTRDLAVGMKVLGPGIPAGTQVVAIGPGNRVTLSQPATASATAATLDFLGSTGITLLPFSLEGYTYTDKPTLYFNYRIEAGEGSTDVQLSVDDGENWITIAANVHQSQRSTLDNADKTLPNFPSVSSRIGEQPNQLVQELFELTGWRQARIDLGEFAGLDDIVLRINFSPIAVGGVSEGAYFDDFIVGFAERGEMVTGQTSGATGFFDVNTPTSRTTPQQFLEGPYQLEIRRGMEFGMLTEATSNAVQILGDPNDALKPMNVLDTNARRIRGNLHPAATVPFDGFGGVNPGQNLRGDENTPRGQGQFIIEGNMVSDASQYGIRVDAAARDAETGASTMGAVKNTSVVNSARLVPGVVIVNNVVSTTRGDAAILFSGDPNSGKGAQAPTPYGRIINNTIYGGPQVNANGSTTTGSAVVTLATTADLLIGMGVSGPGIPSATRIVSIDSETQITLSANATATATNVPLFFAFQSIGVQVTENAAPTLLNNVFSNLASGITVDGSSAGTVVGFSAFHSTPAGRLGTDQVVLATDPFVNAERRNFYPVAKSLLIDTALDVLAESNDYTAVTQPLGIPLSPIVAPGRDMFGQRRADDPGQETPTGIGADVFKDLGAIDRVDFVQPSAAIAVPLDGSTADRNSADGQVRLENADARGVAKFELQLADVGVGIDRTTVVSEAFEVRRNGTLLVAGTDYSFNYLESANRVVFEAAAIYPMGSYTISVVREPVNGVPTNVITDLAGNPLLPNQIDGTTAFSIDLADAPTPPSGLVALSGDGQIQLSWNAATSDGTPLIRYELQRAENSSFTGATTVELLGSTMTRTDTGVTNGTQYWYRVRAVNAIGDSDWSNEIGPIVPLPIPTFSLAEDTGSSTTDGITRNPLVSVVVQGGATWEYSVNGGTNWTTGTGTSFSLPANATYAVGSIRVRQLSGESRSGERSNASAITIDTIAPAAAPITTVTDDAPLVTGPVANGGTTNDPTPTLSGTTEAGSIVEIFNGTTKLGTATVAGTGWTFTTGTLSDGVYAVTTRATDLAGNVGPDSTARSFTVDTAPPPAPIIIGADDNVGSITGNIPSGGATNDATPTLSGTTTAGSTVTVRRGTTTVGTATANGSGQWTLTVPSLADGTYTFTATTTNAVGNTSLPSSGYTITIDTVALPPVIASVIDDVPVFVGSVSRGGRTNDNTLRIVGTAEPLAPVSIRNGATILGTVVANASGGWEFTTATLADGGVSFTAIATDAVGNTSTASSPAYAVTVDTVAPAAPAITAVIDNVGSITGSVVPGGRTDDTTLRISGTAEPRSRVSVRSGNLVLRTVNADASGNWVVVTEPLPVRLHNLNAIARDEAGNTGVASPNHTVTIDQTAPSILSLGSTAAPGSYGVDAEIAIFARMSERMRAGSAIDVTLNTGAVVRLSTSSERSELNGSYRVAAGAVATPLSIISVANVSPIASDIAGNPFASLPTVPVVLSGINVNGALQAFAVGFSTNPAAPTTTTGSVTSIPISFSTDVTGVSLADFQLMYGERERVSLSTATITGSGRNYFLNLPANLTSRVGSYRLTIGPSLGIRPVVGLGSLTVASEFYWRRV